MAPRSAIRRATGAGLACCLVGAASAAGGVASLDGARVTASLHCCSAPTEADRIATTASATVSSLVEFPENTFAFLVDGSRWDEGRIDIASASIRVDLLASGTTNAGSFNGFVFAFTAAPLITGVAVNPGSSFLPAGLAYSSSQVLVNVANRPYAAHAFLLLDLSLAPVPELPSVVLLAAGLVLLVGHRRQC